jgi:KDO2-lipid IV(A) lauroyltransferase
MNQWHAEGKKMILVMGHYGNWEWAGTTISLNTNYPFYIIYRPLHNPYFDRLVNKMRTRFGSKMVPMKGTLRHMASHKAEAIATVFVGDQTPEAEFAYWTTFLNQETPIFVGTEKIAVKFNDPVVYAWIERVKRGYYLMHYKLLVAEPATTVEGEITKLHTSLLEQQILKIPQYWLWSHKRWKHKRNIN